MVRIKQTLMGDWANLPNDLVVAISKLFTINSDYVKFHAVCKSWQSTLSKRTRHHLPCQAPWLMLPNKDNNTPNRDFFSISDNKVYQLELCEANEKRCCGSSEGWLIFVGECPAITLVNPVTRAQIQLPPLTTFPEVMDFRVSEVGNEYLCEIDGDGGFPYRYTCSQAHMKTVYLVKVVLSKNPTVDNFIAMAIFGSLCKLAFCRSGDDKWTVIEDTKNNATYEDIIYFKGQFYAVTCLGRVVVCDVTGPSPKKRIIKQRVNLCHNYDQKYLVDLSGELLLVYKHIQPAHIDAKGNAYGFGQILFFKVFKLNHSGQKWVQVKSLGDSMLFLGHNSSLSLSAKDFPGCKPNCIYFTDDCFYGELFSACGGYDMGIFNLEDGSAEPFPCYMEKSRLQCQPPILLTPSIS